MKRFLITVGFVILTCTASAADIFIEAESFRHCGGWVTDQQFMDTMGSAYLLAHGKGKPVEDATTTVRLQTCGNYKVYVRTYNWTSPWYKGEGAGQFVVTINQTVLANKLGGSGNCWEWQYAGSFEAKPGNIELGLKDLTGFDGRCDAIFLTTQNTPMLPLSLEENQSFRKLHSPQQAVVSKGGKYDFIVVGGGVAGMCAAVAAARLGLKVALIHDRPILGGNNSSEVRVHLGGAINVKPYPNLGNMVREFGHSKKGNAQEASNYEDGKKMQFVHNEKNVTLFLNTRFREVEMKGSTITSIIVQDIASGKLSRLTSSLFADCTGDGNVGYQAGADYRVGREAASEYGEQNAVSVADNQVLGTSVQWYSTQGDKPITFPLFEYGLQFNEQSVQKVYKGEWTWETGMKQDQISEAEKIRDYGLMVIYSNWSYLKNRATDKERYATRTLDWVAYIAGKRESRRLMGDVVLCETDIMQNKRYEDASATTSWTIDLHYPDPMNSKFFPGQEFKAVCYQEYIELYPIPYRCFYSRNIENLFMAGRNISVTHIALGTVRVMRTTAMMGEVVGMAAFVAHRHSVTPRGVYAQHLDELKHLMEKGCGNANFPDNQQFNIGRIARHKMSAEEDVD